MDITRFGHSCLLVEDSGACVLLDPGTFSSGFAELRGLTAVLITHQHADHLDPDRLPALMAANPDAALYLDEGSASSVELPHTVVRAGSSFDVGTSVEVFGAQHALIHEDIPVVPNVGYLVGGRFFTPGDAFTVPDADVEVLGVGSGTPASTPSSQARPSVSDEPREQQGFGGAGPFPHREVQALVDAVPA